MKIRTKDDIIDSIVKIAGDYRNGSIMNVTHVNEWISQFEEEVHLPILTETEHIIRNNYVSKKEAYACLEGILSQDKIFNGNFAEKYLNVEFLDIQERGTSQKDLLNLLNEVLTDKYQLDINDCGKNKVHTYVYIDECMFSGNRVYRDIKDWIENAEINTELHIVFFALYSSNYKYRYNQLKGLCSEKGIKVTIWRIKEYNNIIWQDKYECCWPSNVKYNEDVYSFIDYIDGLRSEKQKESIPILRETEKILKDNLFTSLENRTIVEKTFLEKGVYIYNLIDEPHQSIKPMGYDYGPSLGFGAMFITYRNIPNNCPIVLWWGDRNKQYPINQWYPLFPRKVNND